MALPSTTQVSNSSPKSNEPSNRDEEWPSLQSLTRQTTKQHRETKAAIGLEADVQNEMKLAPGLGPHVQISKIVQDAVSRQPCSRILIHNWNSKAWFYPSKGLNDLFRWAGPKPSGTKTTTAQNLNPKPHYTSTSPSQRRRTYAEMLVMEKGGNGKETGNACGLQWG
jgi:hypothetical protein